MTKERLNDASIFPSWKKAVMDSFAKKDLGFTQGARITAIILLRGAILIEQVKEKIKKPPPPGDPSQS